MYELKVSVKKVMGECTACPPMKPGDYFTVNDGDIQLPEGGYICLWALQSLIPVLTPKERKLAEEKNSDWMWRVKHAQCPDPAGRVIFQIRTDRHGGSERGKGKPRQRGDGRPGPRPIGGVGSRGHFRRRPRQPEDPCRVGDREVHVPHEARCGVHSQERTSLHPARGAHAVSTPFTPPSPSSVPKQRTLEDGDWLKEDNRVLCPDPAGNVILRIERME